MNILFIGDIVGRPGRETVKKLLPELKTQYKIDVVFANGENLSSGLGMTLERYHEMKDAGIDYFTSGNHIWKRKDFVAELDNPEVRVLRPLNYPKAVPGKGWTKIKIGKKEILLINIMGRAYFQESFEDPYEAIDRLLKKNSPAGGTDIIFIDHHAEATSNKKIMGYYVDGRAGAIVGTHTHVATADAMILPKGTAYITDVGMVGVLHSSLGGDYQTFLQADKTQIPMAYKVAKGETIFNAVVIEFDDKTNRAEKIDLIQQTMIT